MSKPKILNLAQKENTQIRFRINKFPDGQQSLTLEETSDFLIEKNVTIKSRLNNFQDLELIVCANQALRNMKVLSVSLYVPYFLGARSDRRFTEGDVHYLKQVICPIINLQNFDSVIVMDPHSDVLEACLDNYQKLDNHLLVGQALGEIDNRDAAQDRIVLVSPDAGAYKKIFDVAQKFSIEKIITANKVRDIKTGKIIRTEIPSLYQEEDLKYVIIDDICDGGRTFIELAKAIHEKQPNTQVYLVVTHGIFSNGFLELSRELTKVFSSNSYSDHRDIEHNSQYTVDKQFLTQLNVF